MKSKSRLLSQLTIVLVSGVVAVGLAPGYAAAQEPGIVSQLEDEDGVYRDVRHLWNQSRFRLFGEGDRAATGMRPTGQMEFLVTNTGIVDGADLNWDSQPDVRGCANCNPSQFQGFDFAPIYAAGRDEWIRFLGLVPSLANATGGGFAVSRNFPTLGVREILASDLQFGALFSGIASDEEGGCLDFSANGPGGVNMDAGLTLLAGSNCPPTHPLVNGVPTFLGDHPVSLENFLAGQAALGSDFNFDWWRVDQSIIDESKIFGNFQTYGAYDDYNSSMIGRFGNVVPGGAGDPLDEGWPLGLRTEFNSFTFALPTVANTQYWRAIIINNTEEVYGVGLDYENLYVGYLDNKAHGTQETAFYHQVWRGVIFGAEGNTGVPACQGVAPPGASFINCSSTTAGFDNGTSAIIVLKSPIGDLRNVLLTCSTTENAQRAAEQAIPCGSDDFNDPSNVHASDTITYNHHVMCPFGPCGSETLLGPDIQMFGALASVPENFLNGRDAAGLPARPGYDFFRNPNFPQQVTPMPFWVPGTWDYSANGATAGGDTIYVPTCYGPPGVVIQGTTREDRTDACVVTWADTMPVGELGNAAYNNQEGNVSYWSVGPFALAAGDTTALVIAKIGAPDSASVESEVNNAIDLYVNFFLSPEAPPKVSIVGVDVQVEDPRLGDGQGEVTLFWDDASDDFQDPFLVSFADKLAAATAGDLLRIATLNPGLEAQIRSRAADNLAEILIFKSCDGGSTFTAQDTRQGILDCDGDPAEDVQGANIGAGWQAYATLPVDAVGDAPNSFLDEEVIPGQTYLYVISGRTRGAVFPIVDQTTAGVFFPDSLVLAPSLTNPLATSTTESNVVSVYVPATVQAGAQLAEAILVEVLGFQTAPADFQFTGREVVEARYRVVFGNQLEVVTVVDAEGEIISTQVTTRDLVFAQTGPTTADFVAIDSVVVASANPNGVSIAGTATVATSGDTTVTTLDDLGFLLFRVDTNEPLLVTTLLDGEKTTPSTFFGRLAVGSFTGFPGFVITVDNTEAGDFDEQLYEIEPGGAEIPSNIEPTLVWDAQDSEPNQAGGITAFGQYDVTWAGFTFGPGSPFELNRGDPTLTDAAFDASLAARAVGRPARTDAVAAQAISDVTGTTVTVDDLVAVKVPFTVSNSTFGRDVEVAMIARTTNTLLLGNQGVGDTLSVTVADDAWIPGDELFFIETLELDSVNVALGAVVLGSDGKPIRVQKTVATFAPAVLSCLNLPRAACNPVEGRGSTNDWVSNVPGQNLAVRYVAPFNLASDVTFDVLRGITGEDLIAAGLDIRAQLDSVKVVPNPYIMFSQYQIATTSLDDARLMFTHLPPEGTLRIFTVSGQFVQEISYDPGDLAGNGDLFWNLRTKEGTDVGAGLYIFVLTALNPATGGEEKKIGKFVVIR